MRQRCSLEFLLLVRQFLRMQSFWIFAGQSLDLEPMQGLPGPEIFSS